MPLEWSGHHQISASPPQTSCLPLRGSVMPSESPGVVPMTENVVQDYGWSTAQGPHSCGYISPRVLEVLESLKIRRILDLGAGNGALCSRLASSGYESVGVEYDAQGVEIAKRTHPAIPFYRSGVQDDPKELMKCEKPFDAVVSTEVVEHLYFPHLLPQFAYVILKE